MKAPQRVRHLATSWALAALVGCASSGGVADGTTPFLTRAAARDGLEDIALTALSHGRIIESNGCLVVREGGTNRAVVFGPGFSLDRARGLISDGAGRTLKLGEGSWFGSGNTGRIEADQMGNVIPAGCPDEWVRIDSFAEKQRDASR